MKTFLIGLAFGAVLSACGSLMVPKLQGRSLHIHESGRLFYRYCKKGKALSSGCKKWQEDYYDLKDPLVRAKLTGFVCRHRNRGY